MRRGTGERSLTRPQTRRQFLNGHSTPPPSPSQRERLIFRPADGPAGDVLVCVFLRGGVDGLHLVAPVAEDEYFRFRPTLAVARPDDRAAGESRGLPVDDRFALHPALAPLRAAWDARRLAIVHACGSPDQTRSHFEAMATMERGVSDGSAAATGWLGRHLAGVETGSRSPLRALAFGDMLPDSLQGALGATAIRSLAEFKLAPPAAWLPSFRATLAMMYGDGQEPDLVAGRETLNLLASLERLSASPYRPDGGATYPTSDFGRGLSQVAQLIKAEVGLEVACVDLNGWDSHVAQTALLDSLMRDLAQGLAAFHTDLDDRLQRVTLVAMSEFGRRVQENGGLGTDHGRGTAMFVLGGGIRGGRVFADWPGLDAHSLEGPGDLPVTTDYRDVLAEIVKKRLRNPATERVFPQHQPRFRGLAV